MRDRVVQEAVRMALEPILEADFVQHSFGFRPNRRTMDAIRCITYATTERKKFFWVIEGDISAYFETIHHRKLMKFLHHRVRDGKLLDLIRKFLRAGVRERKLFKETKQGTPQGGIVTPQTILQHPGFRTHSSPERGFAPSPAKAGRRGMVEIRAAR